MRTILVAECDVLRRAEITALFDCCYRVIVASGSGEMLSLIEKFHPAAVLVGQGFAGDDTLLVIEKTVAASPRLCVIVLSESGDMDFAVNALKACRYRYNGHACPGCVVFSGCGQGAAG